MQLYPAIDIKNGKCVRLRQGRFDDVTIYNDDPVSVAKEFETKGATFIHCVDLDGARDGESGNVPVILKVAESVSIPVEIGGGIRSEETVRKYLDGGIARVIIGTKAVREPEFVEKLIKDFGSDRVVVGIDAKDGMTAISGWEEVSKETAVETALKMKAIGVKTIIYTDISRDGMLTGPNYERTKELADKTGLFVVASGGISGIDNLSKLDELGIPGVIIGKAIYEKRIDLEEAVKQFERKIRRS